MTFSKGACALLGCLLVAGCTGLAQQTSVDGLESRIDAVRDDLSDQITRELSEQEETRTVADANTLAQLTELSQSVAQLGSKIDRRCRATAAVTPAPAKCDKAPIVMHDDRMVVGEVERVRVDPPGFSIDARIDTGASSSSLHAQNVTEFERDGEDWVRFDVADEAGSTTIERPVQKYVRVIQQSDREGTRRPVVNMRIAIGNVQDTFEFTLADRSHLEHNMILGRNFLTDIALVDVGRQFVQPLPQK